MNKAARRVALLARPGAARDRMREALDLAGANIVLEADPATTDQEVVLAAQPEAALIVLDAATDEALDRFEAVVSNPQIEVFFEEAELAVGPRRLGCRALGASPARQAPAFRQRAAPGTGIRHAIRGGASNARGAARRSGIEAGTLTRRHRRRRFRRRTFTDLELVAIELGDEAVGYVREVGAESRAGAWRRNFELEHVDGMVDAPVAEGTPFTMAIEGLELDSDHPSDTSRFQDDMADLHSPHGRDGTGRGPCARAVRGAILVLAGIGGPDAVRQLLGALPEASRAPCSCNSASMAVTTTSWWRRCSVPLRCR